MKFNRFLISFIFLIFLCSIGISSLPVSLSDQGTDVLVTSTNKPLNNGNLTITIWDSLTAGNLIYNETFTNAIQSGAWNVMLGETTALNLEFGKIYYKDYEINGEDASFTNGTGATVGRQFFHSPLGDIDISDLSQQIMPITKTLYVNKNRVDSYTETGSIIHPYKTIQSAITAGTSGTLIEIESGTYVENLTLKPGVYLKNRLGNSFYGVTINGKITYSSGVGRIEMAGIYVYNVNDHALEFIGTDAQKLSCHNCKFETNSNGLHHAIIATNTNPNSELFIRNSLIQVRDSSGGAKCIDTDITSASSIGLKDTTIRIIDNTDNVAIDLDGGVSYWQTMDEISGRVTVATGASATISMVGLYSSTQPVLTTNSAGTTVLSGCMLSSTASPIVTGAGAFAYSGVNYIAAGTGFAGTLNGGSGATIGAIPSESASNTIYDNTTSRLTSTLVQTAIDEIFNNIFWIGDSNSIRYNGDVGIGIAPIRNLHISDTMRIEPSASPPASGSLGDLYVDTSNAICFYNSTAWEAIGGVGTCA